jgi:hypothetical protein
MPDCGPAVVKPAILGGFKYLTSSVVVVVPLFVCIAAFFLAKQFLSVSLCYPYSKNVTEPREGGRESCCNKEKII